MKPIVHIAVDEKFIDAAYDIYERAFPGKNTFIVLLESGKGEVDHVSKDKDYIFISTSGDYISQIADMVQDIDLLVFHYLGEYQARLSLSLPNSIKKVWTVFGHEIYNDPYLVGTGIYGKKTFKKFLFCKYWFKKIFRRWYYLLVKQKKDPLLIAHDAMKKMDFIGIFFQEEFELYKQLGILSATAKKLKFTYYPLDIVIDESQSFVNDKNILLGNSATYTNNHLEVFSVLGKMNLENQRIIAPLSYGNNKYVKEIISEGKSLFGKKFTPLTKFLPLESYQAILQTCGIVIMNHYRQQAVGNVLNTMYLGAKVFLSKKNTLYHYLKRIGCYVYCIEEDLVLGNGNVFRLLDKRQKQHNRKILKEELSLERICKELQENFNPLLS